MKKYLILLGMVLFAVVAMAQERTVNSDKTTLGTDVSYLLYTGVAADALVESTRDTIDYVFTNKNHGSIEKVVFTCSMDSTAGNDSVYYSLTGYNDLAVTGTSIDTGGVLINELDDEFVVSKWYWTNATTFVDLNYRYFTLRLIQDGNNDYDGGASLNWIKAKVYLK